MNILVTGGTGFIGSRLALKHLEMGDSVRVLSQQNTLAEAQNRRLIESKGATITLASVAQPEAIREAVAGIDVVYHLAAAQHEANVPDQRFWDVNVAGTRNMLEASAAARVKRFVHGSTIGVYGAGNDTLLDEHSALNPDNIYGVTKLEGERLALSFSREMPVVIIRISETYGPGDLRLLKLFLALKKRVFCMIGRGTNFHHPIYIDDLTDGLMSAVRADNVNGGIFVLAGKQALTTNEMVRAIAKALGTPPPRIRIPLPIVSLLAVTMEKALRPMGIQPPVHRRRLDFFRKSFRFASTEATTRLGFIPKFDFAQGVRETAGWYSEQGYL